MNTTTYHKISTDEFETFMSDYDAERVEVDGTNEYVYDIPTAADGVVIRVYSTLTEKDTGARDAGRDAIRTLAYAPEAGEILDSATRTHRIDSWADNLAPKIDALQARAAAGELVDPLAETKAMRFDTAEGEAGTVYVAGFERNSYGDLRAKLDGDTYDAKETIKSVGWDETHHKFDPTAKTWDVDATALPAVADALHADGFALLESEPVDDDGFDLHRALAVTPDEGDRVTVTYAKKNGNGNATKSGTVESLDDDRLTFRRDDDQLMYVTNDGLYTSMSAYPFVGEPVGLDVEVTA